MLLKFGCHNVVVVSSPSMVEECFTKKDSIVANRPSSPMHREMTFDFNLLASTPYGDTWRTLRRVSNNEIFSTPRLNSFEHVRKDETIRLCRKLYQTFRDNYNNRFRVNMREMFNNLTFNVLMRMSTGKRYFDDDNLSGTKEANEFQSMAFEYVHIGGVVTPEMFFPALKFITGYWLEMTLKRIVKRTDKFLEGILDEARNKEDGLKTTMVDHLLSLQKLEPKIYTDMFIKGSIMQVLLGGIHTIMVTFEWVMANLINHQEILKKARNEIDSVLGQSRLMEESDIPKLHYLRMIILETLRLNPPLPIQIPHSATSDCTIGGYEVPKETIVLVNSWAIHRNPMYWDDPTSFKPERFEKMEKNNGNYKMIPFGVGRRGCPGEDMAFLVLGLGLGRLIQCFDWERASDEQLDLSEDTAAAFIMIKAKPLEAVCKARDIAHQFLA